MCVCVATVNEFGMFASRECGLQPSVGKFAKRHRPNEFVTAWRDDRIID